jgi:sulfonate transport system permease protein
MTSTTSIHLLQPARHPVPKAIRGWVLPATLVALWWAAYRFGWTDSVLLVPVGKVWETAARLSGSGELWIAIGASLGRNLAGFALGSSAGLLLGTLIGVSRLLENLVGPTFHTVKQVSLFAWIPMISMWFGLGEPAKIVFIALAAFFPVFLNAFEGVRSVPRELVEVSRILSFSRVQVFLRVIVPGAMPSILTGVRLGLIYSWLGTLGAEYLLTAGTGIGNLLTDGREHFWMDQVILGVIVIGVIGSALAWSVGVLERRLLAWRGTSTAKY